MTRAMYGMTDWAYLGPGSGAAPVYFDPGFTQPATDLRTVNYTTGTPTVGAPQQKLVRDQFSDYYAFYGPDGWSGPLYTPRDYTDTGQTDPDTGGPLYIPDPTAGPLRLDPAAGRAATKDAGGAAFDIRDWCACDGITDDTNAFRALERAAFVASANGATIFNPGLPVAIKDTVLIRPGVTIWAPTGGLDGKGAMFRARGPKARVVIYGRGGGSNGWTIQGANIAKPQQTVVTFTATAGSDLVSIAGLTDAQLDGLWGQQVVLPGADVNGTSHQTVIEATPGVSDGIVGVSPPGTVRLLEASITSVTTPTTGWVGEAALCNFVNANGRSFMNFSVHQSLSDNARIDLCNNASWYNFQSTQCVGVCLIVDKVSAGARFDGLTHLAHGGRGQLVSHDSYNLANEGGNTRHVTFGHLIAESNTAVVNNIALYSAERFLFGTLSSSMTQVIPAFTLGATYSDQPQRNGTIPNVVDYNGHYWQVVDGAGQFVAASAPGTGVDVAKWEDQGTQVRLFHVLDEPASPGGALNQVEIQGPTNFTGNLANRTTIFTLDGDSRPKYPYLHATGLMKSSGCATFLEHNQGPTPVFAVTTNLINVGAMTTGAKASALGLMTSNLHGQDHNPIVGRDPLYHHYGGALACENMTRREARDAIGPITGNVTVWPFTPDVTQTITKAYATLQAIAVTPSGVHRLGLGLWDDTTQTYTPLAETADLTTAIATAGNVDTQVGGAFTAARDASLAASVKLTRGVRYAWAFVGTATTMPKLYGTAISKGDATRAPYLAGRKGSQTDLPVPAVPLAGVNTVVGGIARVEGQT